MTAQAAQDVSEGKKRKAEGSDSATSAKEAKSTDGKQDEQAAASEEWSDERDAPLDDREALKAAVCIEPRDCTLNLIPSGGGTVLKPLSEMGMQYLIAAARGNVGIKAGRYLFELRILEVISPAEAGQRRGLPAPKQYLRVGFSTANSSLFLGETEDSVCFDSEGCFIACKKKTSVCERFPREQVIGMLLNLDEGGVFPHTVSIFLDGQRACTPMPLPEGLHGKTLFPHVSMRNVSVQLNFGPNLMANLPFTCRSLQTAALADVDVTPPLALIDGLYNVILPTAVPDEGTFDWLDGFLQENPNYVELSGRKVIEWAWMSGLGNPKMGHWKSSNDRPDANLGIPSLDELKVLNLIYTAASLVPRHYIIMEVRGNLVKKDRANLLGLFGAPHYRRISYVVMGDPPEQYIASVRQALLKDKQEKVNAQWEKEQEAMKKRQQIEKKQRELKEQAEKRRAAMEAAKKAAAEAKAAKEEVKEEKEEVKEEPAEGAEVKDEVKEEVKEEAKQEPEDVPMEAAAAPEPDQGGEPAEEEMPQGPPEAQLTEQEMSIRFRPQAISDLTAQAFSLGLSYFSFPSLEEGFKEACYPWEGEEECRAYLQRYLRTKKLTTRAEGVQPSPWFFEKMKEWEAQMTGWKAKQREFQAEAAKAASTQQKKAKADGGAAKEGGETKPDEGEGGEAAATEPAAQEESQQKEEAAQQEEEEEEIDVMAVEDILNVVEGQPLFAKFQVEDWTVLGIRLELLLLVKGFQRDVDDPDRQGMHEAHLAFYYNRYYRKQLNFRSFGCSNLGELIDMIQDTVVVNDESILVTPLPDDLSASPEHVLKFVEERRRARERRIEAGDESAKLKFSASAGMNQLKAGGPAAVAKPPGAIQNPGFVQPKAWTWMPGFAPAAWRP